jgi:hypothetical protein
MPRSSPTVLRKGFLRESVFLSWINPHLEDLRVDKTYDFTT